MLTCGYPQVDPWENLWVLWSAGQSDPWQKTCTDPGQAFDSWSWPAGTCEWSGGHMIWALNCLFWYKKRTSTINYGLKADLTTVVRVIWITSVFDLILDPKVRLIPAGNLLVTCMTCVLLMTRRWPVTWGDWPVDPNDPWEQNHGRSQSRLWEGDDPQVRIQVDLRIDSCYALVEAIHFAHLSSVGIHAI